MRVLAVVLARGGSKGLVRKNVLPLGGVPLIGWSIQTARRSKLITKTIVSTDDHEIRAAAIAAGGNVPWLRPAELATDTATSMQVLRHALHAIDEYEIEPYDAVCLLQPTSPFRSPADIDGAIKTLRETGAPSVISICPMEHPLAWSAQVSSEGHLELPFLNQDQVTSTQRQAHRPGYRLNGAVYVYRREVVQEHPTGIFPNSVPWIMDQPAETLAGTLSWQRSIDIDVSDDLELAEAVLIQRGWSPGRPIFGS